MFLLAIIGTRITSFIGEANNILKKSGQDVDVFISKQYKSLVVFTDSQHRFDFCNYAIYKHKREVGFIEAPFEEGKKYDCSEMPCFVPFINGTRIKSFPDPKTAIEFSKWMKTVFSSSKIMIEHPEELRVVFNTPGAHVIGIGIKDRPESLRKEIPFYIVPSSFLTYFNINVTNGIYVYRHSDRQLVRASVNPSQYFKSSLFDLRYVDFNQSSIYGGIVMNDLDPEDCEKNMDILIKLSSIFPKLVLGSITGSFKDDFVMMAKTQFMKPPYLVIMNSTSRWVLTESINESNTKDFVGRIIDGIEQPTVVYQTKFLNNYDTIPELTRKNIFEEIDQSQIDKAIYFVESNNYKTRKSLLVAKEAQEILKDQPIQFYIYNLSHNDIPIETDIELDPPMMMFWKRGFSPVIYDGDSEIEELIRFFKMESSSIQVPTYNSTDVTNRVKRTLNPFFKG